jgi:hypothetical protein
MTEGITPDPLPPRPTSDEITPTPAGPPPTVTPRFHATPYRPDTGIDPLGLLLVVPGTLAAAAVVGLLFGLLHGVFYLVFLFPVFMGGAVGLIGAALARPGKLRNPGVAAGIGVVGGVAVMAFMHLVEAWRVGLGFDLFEYLDLYARVGVTIGKPGQSGSGMNLGYVGSWIYWGVETAISACVGAVAMQAWLGRPYCPDCDAWKRPVPLGMIDVPTPQAVAAVVEGDAAALLPRRGPETKQGLRLTAHVCPTCEGTGDVEITLTEVGVTPQGQPAARQLVRVTYPGALWREIAPFAGPLP